MTYCKPHLKHLPPATPHALQAQRDQLQTDEIQALNNLLDSTLDEYPSTADYGKEKALEFRLNRRVAGLLAAISTKNKSFNPKESESQQHSRSFPPYRAMSAYPVPPPKTTPKFSDPYAAANRNVRFQGTRGSERSLDAVLEFQFGCPVHQSEMEAHAGHNVQNGHHLETPAWRSNDLPDDNS